MTPWPHKDSIEWLSHMNLISFERIKLLPKVIIGSVRSSLVAISLNQALGTYLSYFMDPQYFQAYDR